MKKNVLALSMSAAILSFGFAGAAYAITDLPTGADATAAKLAVNPNGVGQMLLVPYYTAQDKNSTLLNLVNTDTNNGKIVKVRFRGAANSDDVLDFQVFMSPGDVWSANISQDASGLAKLTTADKSCTKPANVSVPFKTGRLDQSMSTALKAGGTREGYVEIFNIADVQKTAVGNPDAIKADGTAGTNGINDLYDIIKHQSGKALCAGTTWDAINANLTGDEYRALGMDEPTTGLTASWTIINVDGAAAWAANATALQIINSAGAAVKGNLLYWPQVANNVGSGKDLFGIANYTDDPLLVPVVGYDSVGAPFTPLAAVTATWVDLPDMSTPYFKTTFPFATGASFAPDNQTFALTAAIAVTDVMNEYLSDSSVQSSTDWVFTMPTRRYHVALDYAKIGAARSGGATDTGKRFSSLDGYWFNDTNTSVQTLNGYREICVSGIEYTPWNREEGKVVSVADVVVSPAEPTPGLSFCGEASVLSFNNGGTSLPTATLKAVVAQKDIDVTFTAGWMQLEMKNGGVGLPVIGTAFTRAAAGSSMFGGNWDHKFVPAAVQPVVN